MKNYKSLKEGAVELRKKGWSYREIQKEIPVAKSSLSLWLKNIELSPEHKKRLYTKQISILSLGSQSQKERRAREVLKIIQDAEREIRLPLSFDIYRLMGAALYWAEGSKGKMFEFTNSDPNLILFMVKWINRIFKISPKDLKGRLNLYPQQNEKKIKKFWSELTGIPVHNFGKSYIKPLSSGYKKNNLYHGTMRIEVPKSVDLHYRLYGWIKASFKDVSSEADMLANKWNELLRVNRPAPINLKRNSL